MEKVIFNKFNSVEEFSNWLQVTPQTAKGKEFDESNKTDEDYTEFSGTKSFDEAQNLLKYGDKVNADKITATIRKIKAQGKGNETRNKLYNSPCGFMPIVPKVLAGDPQNMLAIRKERYKSTKVLNIAYNTMVSWSIPTEEIIETAAKVANVIASLEKNGYRVNLYAFSCGIGKRNTAFSLLVKIKDSGKYFDTLRIAYPLVNPSFLRRHTFAYLERLKGYGIFQGYNGVIKNDSKVKEYLPINASYLSFYNCKGKSEQEITKMIENAK